MSLWLAVVLQAPLSVHYEQYKEDTIHDMLPTSDSAIMTLCKTSPNDRSKICQTSENKIPLRKAKYRNYVFVTALWGQTHRIWHELRWNSNFHRKHQSCFQCKMKTELPVSRTVLELKCLKERHYGSNSSSPHTTKSQEVMTLVRQILRGIWVEQLWNFTIILIFGASVSIIISQEENYNIICGINMSHPCC